MQFDLSKPLVAVALSCGLASAAGAATICVDPDDGTCQATIQAGINAAAAGDTVEVAKGLYLEAVTIPAGKDGLVLTGKATIDAHAAPPAPDPNDPNGPGFDPDALVVQSNDVRIEGIAIQNGRSRGISGEGSNGLTITKVTVRGPSSDCIHVDGNDLTVTASLLQGCGSDAIDFEGDGGTLLKNKISNCDNDCIRIDGNDTRIEGNAITLAEDGTCIDYFGDNGVILKNRLVNCDEDGVDYEGDDGRIEGNKISYVGTGIDYYGDNPTIVKNKVVGAENDGIDVTCFVCSGGLVTKNKVRYVVGDDDCFDVHVEGSDPNDPNAPTAPPTNPFLIEGNSAGDCADGGFSVSGNGATLRKNSAKRCGGDEGEEGYDISGVGHLLEGNMSSLNFSTGFTLFGGAHVLNGNSASTNYGDGFRVFASSDGGTSFTGNKAKNNLGQGFAINVDPNDPPAPSTLTENSASGNYADFCEDPGAGSVLTDNSFKTTASICLDFD